MMWVTSWVPIIFVVVSFLTLLAGAFRGGVTNWYALRRILVNVIGIVAMALMVVAFTTLDTTCTLGLVCYVFLIGVARSNYIANSLTSGQSGLDRAKQATFMYRAIMRHNKVRIQKCSISRIEGRSIILNGDCNSINSFYVEANETGFISFRQQWAFTEGEALSNLKDLAGLFEISGGDATNIINGSTIGVEPPTVED